MSTGGGHTLRREVTAMREKLGLLGCLAALGVLLLCSADTAQAVREGLALCAGS